MFDKIVKMICERQNSLTAAQITEKTDLYLDLGWTSMDMMGCVMDLEDIIGREIPDEELNSIHTVGDLCALAGGEK